MNKIPFEVPTSDEMDAMTLDELNLWKKKLEPYYLHRMNYEYPESKKVFRYLWFGRMVQNIEDGIDRWYQIDRNRVKKIPENEENFRLRIKY